MADVVPLEITQGGTYEGAFNLVDEAFAPIDSNWEGRMEIRDSYGGALITAFASSGEDGTLTIDDYGHVLLFLPSSATEVLAPTTDARGLNARTYVADIEVWLTASPTNRYKPDSVFRVKIQPEVTQG